MYCFRNLEMLFICRFDQCTISPLSLKAVKDAGYERMTQVQEATLPVILQGKDVLAKAKTGTGKTVAFLVLILNPNQIMALVAITY
jgi:superfamily II DNA/RNA helicase